MYGYCKKCGNYGKINNIGECEHCQRERKNKEQQSLFPKGQVIARISSGG